MEDKKKPYVTLQELAEYYEVSITTLHTYLKPIKAELIAMYKFPRKKLSLIFENQAARIKEFLGQNFKF